MNVRLQTIGVIANEMRGTLDFYRRVGLPIPSEAPEDGNLDVELPNGVTLGFLSRALAQRSDPTFREGAGASLNLQFELDTPAAVDALFARLTGAGHPAHTPPWDAPWGQRFARVVDPDGRVVNFYARSEAR